ncbi:MAG: hypothetical protein B9S32_04260 [Verrucomicrobia bacterium Tous-C9LFEB]|nr:MAG: hypothetical protein B9S32_04260 [Verrucomicrobia bacterium Tous-C9LFEB]
MTSSNITKKFDEQLLESNDLVGSEPSSSLKGRTALITGSSQGLGRAMAIRLAGEGCNVAINHLGGGRLAKNVVDLIQNAGGKAAEFEADISDEEAVSDLFSAIQHAYGAVDILINNARLDPWRRSADMTEGQWWDMVMKVNLKGAYLSSWKFMQQIGDRRWGRIVNISSVRSFVPAERNMIAYGVSKLGMHGLTRSFAEWGAPLGVTVNTVAPGVVATENIHKRLSAEKYASEISRVPIGRASSMDEIANAVLFVLQNGSVTGETVNINGGMHYPA